MKKLPANYTDKHKEIIRGLKTGAGNEKDDCYRVQWIDRQ